MLDIFVCGWSCQPIHVSSVYADGRGIGRPEKNKPPTPDFLDKFCTGCKKMEDGLNQLIQFAEQNWVEIAVGTSLLMVASPLIASAFACSLTLITAAVLLLVLSYIFTGIPFGALWLISELNNYRRN